MKTSKFDCEWSEVNSLVYTLSKSSCPMKTIEKWFPESKRHKNTQLNGRNDAILERVKKARMNYSLDKDENKISRPSSYGAMSKNIKEKKQEDSTSPILHQNAQISGRESGQIVGQYKEDKNTGTFTHNKQVHQHMRKALLVQSEVKFCSQSPYDCLFTEVNRAHNKELNDIKLPDRTTLSIQEMTSIRKKVRNDSKERFKAGCSERLSALRVQVVKQRYELHLAEVRRREMKKERLTNMQQKNKLKRNTTSSANELSKLVKAMETGMLLISD